MSWACESELENRFELNNARRCVATQERTEDTGRRTGRADDGSEGWRRNVEVGILEVGGALARRPFPEVGAQYMLLEHACNSR